ncbi:acyltransferase family protein [Acetobacter fallax]|uniref:DUF5009 domain-containing protein n=1 Tax=Acetobacter fallax TaxID=1737473 RepID=A0ABX0K508_9PROT|nr:DUF5009 domain-containing protein [Acetobacter fallax]NHO31447.1 DUF5009 domain-containing protein [Acetobacter fallax]NHO34969.1 DUF5009 domain-containing protein [Acetobacter fallax]
MTQDTPIEIRRSRVESLDVMRGLTVAFMILVNDPGDWGQVFPPLLHAKWNGFTPTDLVFPSFLFIMGCAVPFSLGGRMARGEKRSALFLDILRRSVILFALGISLALFPHFHIHHLRFFGVLERFAACYLVCGTLFLYVRNVSSLWLVFSGFLAAYWVLVAWVPIPGIGMPGRDVPFMDPHSNIVAWCDRAITDWTQSWLGIGRLYEHDRDPEGLLSTLPAFSTVIAGIIAGLAFREARARGSDEAITRWAFSGPVLLGCALIAVMFFPLNKNMWTSSFVLLCAGIDTVALFVLYRLVDVRRVQERSSWARGIVKFGVIFGSNPIVAFMLSELGSILLWVLHPADGITTGGWIYETLFARGGSTPLTSLLFAIAYVGICFIPSYVLWKRRIIVKI